MRLKDIAEIDFALIIPAILLTVFGVLFIYSSAVSSAGSSASSEYTRQIFFGAAGLVLALVIAVFNYRRVLYDTAVYIYIASLLLLAYTCLFGRVVNGSRSWLGLGGFGVQPSEFAKLTSIILLARFLDATKRGKNDLVRFAVSCAIVMTPMLIVLLQPDFGTSLVFIPILLLMTFIAGIQVRYILFFTVTIAVSGILTVLPLYQTYILKREIPLLSLVSGTRFAVLGGLALTLVFAIALFGFLRYRKRYFYWINYGVVMLILSALIAAAARKVLKPYQIMRLIVFLDPGIDPRGSGWNIIQSITAIGSGGLFGKGFLRGTQSHYSFLPQQSTDFIFSIFSEEWGLAGGLLVFVAFLLICLRLVKIMRSTEDAFGCYIAAGLAGMYIFHFLVNVGMTMGIMPITGIPLLFMSYGGSALISAMTGIGLALSVQLHRFH